MKIPLLDSFRKSVEPLKDLFLDALFHQKLFDACIKEIQRDMTTFKSVRNKEILSSMPFVIDLLDRDDWKSYRPSCEDHVPELTFSESWHPRYDPDHRDILCNDAMDFAKKKHFFDFYDGSNTPQERLSVLLRIHYARECMDIYDSFPLFAIEKMIMENDEYGKIRYALVHEEGVSSMLLTIEALDSNRSLLDLTSGTGHLAASLSSVYHFFCHKENFLLEPFNEAMVNSIKILENYANHKSSSVNMICYTCQDEDTKGYEVFVCQGCRVACYCCKDHQRLNYLHHENTGTRGLGHQYLCPVYKTYRKMKDNTDGSKDGHLERKFQRACMRFILNSLKNIGNRKKKIMK